MINYLDYTYQSNKGQVTAGQVFNSALHGSFSDVDYTSAYINGETYVSANGSEKTIQLAWTPVDIQEDTTGAYSNIEITVNGTALANDKTAYTVSPDGVVTLTNALSQNDVVVTKYYFLNEVVRSNGFDAFGVNGEKAVDGAVGGAGFTNVPEIGLKMNSRPIIAKARTLRAYWAFDAKLVA